MACSTSDTDNSFSEILIRRNSVALLSEPGPLGQALHRILQAGLSAPDHGVMRPWRFLTVEGDARAKLGKLFADSARKDQPDLAGDALLKFQNMPLRAPLLIVGVVRYREDLKVPHSEQLLSAGAAMSYMLAAAQAEGFGAIWRTGPMAYHKNVLDGLGLAENEAIIGFLYVGTPSGSLKSRPLLAVEDYCSSWG